MIPPPLTTKDEEYEQELLRKASARVAEELELSDANKINGTEWPRDVPQGYVDASNKRVDDPG